MVRFFFALLLCSLASAQNTQQAPAASGTEAMYKAAADSADRKMAFLTQNAIKAQPDPHPTEFTELEVNAYLNSGKVDLPTVNDQGHDPLPSLALTTGGGGTNPPFVTVNLIVRVL